jgi:hypothetical protein
LPKRGTTLPQDSLVFSKLWKYSRHTNCFQRKTILAKVTEKEDVHKKSENILKAEIIQVLIDIPKDTFSPQ